MKHTGIRILLLLVISGTIFSQETDLDPTEMKCGYAHSAQVKSALFVERESYNTYDLLYHRIYWKVSPETRYIKGRVSFVFRALTVDLQQVEVDLHDALRIDSITQNQNKLPFLHQSNGVTVSLPVPVPYQQTDSFTIHYQGIPPQTGSGSFVTQLRDSIFPELWTLSEPYGAMEWWPCKQSLQDKVDSLDIFIEIPAGYKAASNGLLVEMESVSNQHISHWKHRYPVATYLIAMAVTNYVEFSDYHVFEEGDSMQLIHLVFPEFYDQAQKDAVKTTAFMQLFSELFMPYPFKNEWYGHAQFSRGGGMEHQTMSFMGNLGFELVAHELAHQWFGNYATLNSWHDIWLNEGFATFLTGLCYEHLHPSLYRRFYDVRLQSIVSKPDGSVYVPDTTDVSRIFSGRLSYGKGAYLLRMLRWELGDTAFFKGIRSYLADERLQYGFTSQQLLVEHLELAGDTLLSGFFDQWYYGEGYPIYYTSWHQSKDSLYLTIEQETSHPSVEFFSAHVPIKVYTSSDTVLLRLHHTHNGQHFTVPMKETIELLEFDPDLWLISKHSTVTTLHERTHHQLPLAFPNPTRGRLYIHLPNGVSAASYTLFTLNGKQILAGTLENNTNTIPVHGLRPGIYMLQFYTAEEAVTLKIHIGN